MELCEEQVLPPFLFYQGCKGSFVFPALQPAMACRIAYNTGISAVMDQPKDLYVLEMLLELGFSLQRGEKLR